MPAERACLAGQDQYRDALNCIKEGFALFDRDDRLVLCNQHYLDFHPERHRSLLTVGTSFETIFRNCVEVGFIPTDEYDSVDEFIRQRLDSHRSPRGSIERRLADGRTILIDESRTSDGGTVHVVTDVTELKRQEQEIRRQSLLLQATLDNIDQGISVCDRDLNVVIFNRRYLELMEFPEATNGEGIPLETFIRRNAERGEYGPGDLETIVAARVAAARRFEPLLFERTRPNGVVLEIRSNPMPGGGFVRTFTDITERQRARDALRASEERLRERVHELELTRERSEAQRRELSQLADTLARAKEEAEAASRTKS